MTRRRLLRARRSLPAPWRPVWSDAVRSVAASLIHFIGLLGTVVFRRRQNNEARRLVDASTPDHSERLERQQQRRIWLSRLRVAVRDRGAQLRQDGSVFIHLVGRVVAALVGTAALVATLEAIASSLTHVLHWGTLFDPVGSYYYGGFVATAVGAEAAFLALFFTTVGVIASTTYSRVPGEVRSLFVRERTNLIYVWNVAVALLVGIALLMMPVVTHHSPYGLTVAVFALLTAFSVLSLILLGTQLFNFFDLSTLSRSLSQRFNRGIDSASAAGKTVPAEAQQQAAHDRAADALHIYGQLSNLIASRDVAEAQTPEQIAVKLLECWSTGSALKSKIPTESKWYHLTPAHPNWLTMRHTQSGSSENAGVQPTFSLDPLWVEGEIARCLGRLLSTLATQAEWPRGISVVDEANKLVFSLTARLQLDEARLLLRTVRIFLDGIASGDLITSGTAKLANSEEWQVPRMAAAERATLGYIQYWLGLVSFFEEIDPQRLRASFDEAVDTPQGPYKAEAPRVLLDLFEDIAEGVAFEKQTEYQRVTPSWWVHHMAARTLLHALVQAIRAFFEVVQVNVIAPLLADTESAAELITIRIFDALKLVHKLTVHLPMAHKAVTALDSMRHSPSNNELWPDGSLPDDVPPRIEEQLYRKLAAVAPQLGSDPQDTTRPNLFGQSYKLLSDATFHAILGEHTDLARQLFPSFVSMADRSRNRLTHDLAGHHVSDQAILGTEPLVDMMELSGLALLMSNVEPTTGIWADVHAFWDQILSDPKGPSLAAQFADVLSVHANFCAITSGDIARMNRQMALVGVLAERGLTSQDHIRDEPTPTEPENPIVAVFAPWDLGGNLADLADLFVVEYLTQRSDMQDLQIPRRTEMLRESLDHRRQRREPSQDLTEEADEL